MVPIQNLMDRSLQYIANYMHTYTNTHNNVHTQNIQIFFFADTCNAKHIHMECLLESNYTAKYSCTTKITKYIKIQESAGIGNYLCLLMIRMSCQRLISLKHEVIAVYHNLWKSFLPIYRRPLFNVKTSFYQIYEPLMTQNVTNVRQ